MRQRLSEPDDGGPLIMLAVGLAIGFTLGLLAAIATGM